MKPAAVHIRPTLHDDLPEIISLYGTLHRHQRELNSARDWIAPPDDSVNEYFAVTLKGPLGDPGVLLFTALESGRPIGFIRVTRRIINGFSIPHAYIDPVIVSPDARQRGVGTELLRRGLAWCKDRGYGRRRGSRVHFTNALDFSRWRVRWRRQSPGIIHAAFDNLRSPGISFFRDRQEPAKVC